MIHTSRERTMLSTAKNELSRLCSLDQKKGTDTKSIAIVLE